MPVNESGNDAEIVSTLVQGLITVTNTQIEAKVGASRSSGRQMLRIYNSSNVTIYIGTTGVTTGTGEPLTKGNWINIPASDALAIFLIAASGSNSVIVSEWS
jgi:hypothetical protein